MDMKPSRFTEDQIIGILREQEAGAKTARPDDAKLGARLRELATQRRRFGYRRLQILMIREGLA